MSYGIIDVVKDGLTGNLEFVDKETLDKRGLACMTCPELQPVVYDKLGKCNACGCWMSKKIKLKNANCINGKW